MKKLPRVILGVLLGAGLLAISAVDSSAYTVGFGQITTNSGSIYSFSADVNDLGGGNVQFLFGNTTPGIISEVYFDDSTNLLGTFQGYTPGTSAGVNFETPATPASLPAGNTISFAVTDSFQAITPSPTNGVHTDQFLALIFNGTFANITGALDSGDLRLGLHVQSLANGDSESFATPIPSALLLFGSGLVGLVGIGRRKFRM